jgi:recombinational DNA repair protein RecT
MGDDERIEHERKLDCIDDDKIIGSYSVVKLKDGSVIREIMSIAEIEKARNTNRDWALGPWVKWRGEMCRKTVGHRISKSIPRSSDKEGERFHRALERVTSEAVIDGVATEQVTTPRQNGGKLAALENMVGLDLEDDTDGRDEVITEDGEILSPADAIIAEFAKLETLTDITAQEANAAIRAQAAKLSKPDQDKVRAAVEKMKQEKRAAA